MSTPLEVIQEGERDLKTAHADMFKGRVSALYVDKLVTSHTLALLQALLQALHDELEEREMEVEVALGNPEAMAALRGYNDSIQDQKDNLQALMDKIRV